MKRRHRNSKGHAAAAVTAAAITVTLAGPCFGTDYNEAWVEVQTVVTSSLRSDSEAIARSVLGDSSAETAVAGTAGEMDILGPEGAETGADAAIDTESSEDSDLPTLYQRLHGFIEWSAESDSLAAALGPVIERLALRIASMEDAVAEEMVTASRAFWAGIDQELDAIRAERAALLARA